jgi:hypothetical protein
LLAGKEAVWMFEMTPLGGRTFHFCVVYANNPYRAHSSTSASFVRATLRALIIFELFVLRKYATPNQKQPLYIAQQLMLAIVSR